MTEKPILYPPTIIGHITKDITDLFKEKVKGKNSAKVYFGCQLNGRPHLGTTIGLISSYALADKIQKKYSIPTEVVFNALENGPAEKKEVGGILYQRMLCDTPYPEDTEMSVADFNLGYFSNLMNKLTLQSGIPHTIDFYESLQSKPIARQTLLDLLAREDEFVDLLNPSDDRLRVRFRCPICKYEEKHSKTLKIIENNPRKLLRMQSSCFEHGNYEITLLPDNTDFVDVNTMVRNVMKEATVISESKSDNFFPLIVKGADWMHAATLVSNALELLGYSYRERPERIATPMIEDWSSAKFSKSVYVKAGSYEGLPEEFVSLHGFLDKFGEEGFQKLYEHVSSWANDPKKFYRNYSLDYLSRVFN